MTLPSQSARSIRVTSTRPAYRGYRPRAAQRRRVALVVGLAAVAALVFGGWRWLTGLGEGAGPRPAIAGGSPSDGGIGIEEPGAFGDDGLSANSSMDDAATMQTPMTRNGAGESRVVDLTAGVLNEPASRQNTPPARNANEGRTLTMGEPATNRAQPASQTRPSSGADASVANMIDAGVSLISSSPVEAREQFNLALHHPRASETQRGEIRRTMSELNETLVFSTRVVPGDPLTGSYVIKSGDTLGAIASRNGLMVDWRLLLRVNGISDARRIRVGQTLKLVNGPFHAVIDKSDYRMDVYSDRYDSAGNRLFVKSFDIGLGEFGSTPVGSWVVRPRSKLLNPAWTNPRTGERFGADDPMNPIGEAWLGLDGTDPATSEFQGYGIHGTVEPDSIGKDMSMGCVRLLPGEIETVWELLVDGESTVEIVP